MFPTLSTLSRNRLEESLPNITGSISTHFPTTRGASEIGPNISGCFKSTIFDSTASLGSSNTNKSCVLSFTASLFNEVYNGTHVIPISQTCKYLIKY